ncbi:MAG: riboflavin synthase subunit alpha [Bdellovibrionales bacterium]|nr:riboflavin synthase subunit alpha [Bdellovibrionales bacterium]
MYTGIVSHTLRPAEICRKPGLLTLSFMFDDALLHGLELGASVSVDGVCLTVAKIEGRKISFDAMQETLDKTTLGMLNEQQTCNIERSAIYGREIGGHLLSGHIDGRIEVERVELFPHNHVIYFRVPEKLIPYLFEKGFVGLQGCSLTIAGLREEAGEFWVSLIPETLRRTNLGSLAKGSFVNIEIDRNTQVIVDTLRRCFERMQR